MLTNLAARRQSVPQILAVGSVWSGPTALPPGAAVYNDGLPALEPAHEAYAL